MNDNATIQTPEELKAKAQTMLEQAREMEREAQRKIQEQKDEQKTNTLDAIREAFASHPALLVKIKPVMRQTDAWRNRGPYVETGLYTVAVAMKGEGDAVIPIQTYYDVRVEKDGKVHGTVSSRVTVQEHIEKVVK